MTVKSETANYGDKELKENWPITEGLTLGTTKLSKKPNLEAQGLDDRGTKKTTIVRKEDTKLIR